MKLEDAVKKMQKEVEKIKKYADEKTEGLDEVAKEKAKEIVDKTTTVIEEAKKKVQEVAADVQDEEKLNEFLTNVMNKVDEAAEYTKDKIAKLATKKDQLDDIQKQISDSFDKLIENENIQGAVKVLQQVGDSIKDYLDKPETKAKINSAKKATLKVAEKGMDGLRKVLAVEEENKEEK